jgi:hypothetical protein
MGTMGGPPTVLKSTADFRVEWVFKIISSIWKKSIKNQKNRLIRRASQTVHVVLLYNKIMGNRLQEIVKPKVTLNIDVLFAMRIMKKD